LKLELEAAGVLLLRVAPVFGSGRGLKHEALKLAKTLRQSPRSSDRGAD